MLGSPTTLIVTIEEMSKEQMAFCKAGLTGGTSPGASKSTGYGAADACEDSLIGSTTTAAGGNLDAATRTYEVTGPWSRLDVEETDDEGDDGRGAAGSPADAAATERSAIAAGLYLRM